MNTFTFEAALTEAEKAKAFILAHTEEVNQQYVYTFDASVVLDYLMKLWQKSFYVVYDY